MSLLLILLTVIAVYVIFSFNRMVRLKSLMQEAWSGIDVQLKRRHDLIPNLVETVKGYQRHEQSVLENVTALRGEAKKASTVAEQKFIENDLSLGIKSIFALAEAYPDLKADKSFQQLHISLVEIEDTLQMARRYYNGTVRDYNVSITTLPNMLFAGFMGFKRAEFFEIEYATERQVPDVSFKN